MNVKGKYRKRTKELEKNKPGKKPQSQPTSEVR